MSDVTDQIVQLKTQAKNRRDLERWDRAAALLKQGIDLAKEEYRSTKAPEWRATMAAELADCWGMLGAIERRWALDPKYAADRMEHLARSIDAYDKGYRYETESPSGGGSTYNAFNRLLVRLLREPRLLTADPVDGSLNVREEFETIAAQIKDHANDSVWSAADMALINVLLERQDAASAYAAFERMKPPDFARQSALDVLASLAKLDLPAAKGLREAERLLSAGRG